MFNFSMALLLTVLLLYRIYWVGGVTNTSMSITIGLIVLNLVISMKKWREKQRG